MPDAYDTRATLDWRQSMDAALRREEGWLSLSGLFWLAAGENQVGTAPGCAVGLPAGTGPAIAGSIGLTGDSAIFRAFPGSEATVNGSPIQSIVLQPDSSETPTRVRLGQVTFVLVRRGTRWGIRVWDRTSPNRQAYPGRRWFPVRTELLVPGTFIRYASPRPIPIATALGDTQTELCPGHVSYLLGGTPTRLLVTEADDDKLFLVFGDTTNGVTTYPAGRFLATGSVEGDQVHLDFNRAYNPPCAFTPFATCPLPHPENRLPFSIDAGEQYDPAWGHVPRIG